MSAVLIALIALAPAAARIPADHADVCKNLPVPVVQEVLARAGLALEHGSAQPVGGRADDQGCMYSFAGAGGSATIMVSWSELRNEKAASTVFTAQRGGIPGAQPVTGIGSEAVVGQMPGGATLAVRRGKGYGLIQLMAQGSASASALNTAVQELARLLIAIPAAPAAAGRRAAAGARPPVSSAPAATAATGRLTLDRVIAYLGVHQDLVGLVTQNPSLGPQLARNGQTDAAWAKRLGATPALRDAMKSWDMTPAQYIELGRTFYDAWMTHAKLGGPGPKPQPPDPKALEFVRANAGMIAQSPGMIALSKGRTVAPWPGGPLEQSLSGK
jgi:hypothetical protein